jgi:DNA repair exonuclease SbcCD ATPase subunit
MTTDEERIRQLELTITRIEEKLEAERKALELQATEYERRLELLNHEHARAREMASLTVTSERFEEYAKVEAEKREVALRRVEEQVRNLEDSLHDYVPSNVYDERHQALIDRISRMESMSAKLTGGLGVVALIGVTNLIRIWTG